MPDADDRAMPQLTPWAYVLAVQDLERAVNYFSNVLGFRCDWTDVSGWRLVVRDNVRIMLGHCPNEIAATQTGDHSWFAYVQVDDLDALHAEFVARGATIRQAPADKPHGMREMLIATPDGHRIMFGQQVEKGGSSSG